MFILILFICILSVADVGAIEKNFNDNAPTVVFGEAERPDGKKNFFIVEQPKDAPNPLGNPIPVPNTPPEIFDSESDDGDKNSNENEQGNQWQAAPEVPQPMQNYNPQEEGISLGKDFQNTLMEANGRIYDIQSYPKQDINVMSNPSEPQTIYSPNVNGD